MGLVPDAALSGVAAGDRSSDDSEGTFDLGDSCGIRGYCSSRCPRSCGRPYDSEVSDGGSTGRLVVFHRCGDGVPAAGGRICVSSSGRGGCGVRLFGLNGSIGDEG